MTALKKTVIEKFLFPNPQWQDGYQLYWKQLGLPKVYVALVEDHDVSFRTLDRKGGVTSIREHKKFRACESVFRGYIAKAFKETHGKHSESLEWVPGKKAAAFPIRHFGTLKAVLFLCGISQQEKTETLLPLFQVYLAGAVELAYKNFELNNFYETVHPRALALSTMHSVHRVISSSLRLEELLPRMGRLSAQVLKAKGCSIMLVEPSRNYLVPSFSFGENGRFIHRHRIRIGRGLQGKIAATGEYYLSRGAVAAPFIEDDVVGVIALWSKVGEQSFTKIDLEILKSLTEQAVVAIKNAQLFEETERLTLGSIKTINELLELSFAGERKHLPIFGEIVMKIGREMELSTKELIHLERAIGLLDTGALAIPEKILLKKGKLTQKEFAKIKSIPARSANLLQSISSLRPAIPIILHHHERFDGRGYPNGLAGEQIPIGARIVSVVNSFLAMISKRTYREQISIEEALIEIEANKKTQFDPKVVDAFFNVIKRPEISEKLEEFYSLSNVV